jgi:hypothetical protein
MRLASLGLEIGIFCDLLHSVLLLNAVSGLDFLWAGPAPRLQVRAHALEE